MLAFLKFCGYVLILLAVVPLAGLAVSGTWRGAWRYARAWSRVMAITVAVGALLALLAWQFTPPPG